MHPREVHQVLRAALTRAVDLGVAVSVAIVDAEGYLIAFERMPEAFLASIGLAQDKAFTAVMFAMPTDQLAEQAQPGQPLFGVHSTLGGRVVIFGGGIPLMMDGRMVGAIGVSGGKVEEDIAIATAGASGLAAGHRDR